MSKFDDETFDSTLDTELDEYIAHYGTPQRFPGDPKGSGRYREGSGDKPNQHSSSWLNRYNELRNQGFKQTEIVKAMGMKSTTQLRARLSMEMDDNRRSLVMSVKTLRDEKGMGWTEIGRELGIGESTVRSLYNRDAAARTELSMKLADNIQKVVDENKMVDIGAGTELAMSDKYRMKVSKEKMREAVQILRDRGYVTYTFNVPQATNPGKFTKTTALCVPGTEYKSVYNFENIKPLIEYASATDDGDTFHKPFEYPASMDSKRLAVNYGDTGRIVGANGKVYREKVSDPRLKGVEKDGTVEIRRGVKDLSLGPGVHYSQVRILVDGTHYIKGMARYSDDLPDGIDVLFNTNKADGVPILGNKASGSVLKEIKNDPENPFGSAIKEIGGQSYYDDPNGKYTNAQGVKQSLSLINKRASEGDWDDWSKELPSQFLAKQNLPLIRRQLAIAEADKVSEFEKIKRLTNPTIKIKMLEDFAEGCDSASIHLKAATLPGQRYQVIMPVPSLKDNEAFAPNFEDGSQLALVRYPHGGTFEIPIVKVNNRNKEGIEAISTTASDAIGINAHVAERLSGADFDGDTVMVIPIPKDGGYKITSSPSLIDGFDPKLTYGHDNTSYVDEDGKLHLCRGGVEFKPMTNTQTQMGIISNLITDMTLEGATREEIARAVKHSMVVIDAEKHGLDYKQSEIDNGIKQLKDRYQGHINEKGNYSTGAGTLISRAKSPVSDMPERKEGKFFAKSNNHELQLVNPNERVASKREYVDPLTGEVYSDSERYVLNVDPKTGEKLWHYTNRTFKKVKYKDENGKMQSATPYMRDNKYYYKDKQTGKEYEVDESEILEPLAPGKATKMEFTNDARTLISKENTAQEKYYANYANKLKSLANQARLESINTVEQVYSPAARKMYPREVASLNEKLRNAELNQPRERRAQQLAASKINAMLMDDPSLYNDKDRNKKMRQRAIVNARASVNAHRAPIKITDKEWEAIQAGAIAKTTLRDIMKYCDLDVLRQLATPRNTKELTKGKIARINVLRNSPANYTIDEIAKMTGVSPSTITKYLKGENE